MWEFWATFNFICLNILIWAYISQNKQYCCNNKKTGIFIIYGQFLYKNIIHIAKEVLKKQYWY